jgi:hypothetical protein
MSEQDRFDWNEDMNFESEADVQDEYDDFEDPLDGFSDYDEMSGYEDLSEDDAPAEDTGEVQDRSESEAAEVVTEGLAEKIPANKKVAAALKKQKRRRGISAVGLGFMFTVSILVAGVGVGGAILLAEGVHPASLWQPKNLLQIDQLLNFADHPLNILYMVTMGIVFLALLGSYKMSKAAVEANARTRDAEDMLDSLTALSLDKQEDWQSQVFKEFPPAEAFVIRTLGAWRLQEARQKRLMGVEGELHRLEKALKMNSRADLTGRFDHPAVGRLADEMIRYFDARDVAVRKLEENESKDRENNTESIDLLQESRKWNGSTLDHLGVQCVALDELAGQMKNLAGHLENATAEARSTEGMTDIIEGIRKDIAVQSSGGLAASQTTSELNDLVDRGSKLAFKIAMEVARLGPRGERLLPMSQSLEDLTTGFRQLTDRVNDRDGGSAPAGAMNSVHKKLETLAALITQDDPTPWRDMADEVQDFGPAAAQISGKLTRMVDGFNEQEDRLVRLGISFADLTGVEFDSNSIPREELTDAPVASLDIIGQKPLPRSVEPTLAPVPVNPFATADSPFLKPDEGLVDPEVGPEVPGLQLEGPDRFSLNPESSADMPLSEDEEKVYDLEDFEASPAAESETEDTEKVFDISSFGAIPMVDDENQGPDQVFELSDFDPVPLKDDTGDAAEEVYELSDFGASPLDQAVGSDQDGAIVEDDVFDLSDFGAKPMN